MAMPHSREQDEIQSAWEQVEPMLDEALAMLSEADRNLVALRFFEGKNHAQLASALGLSEEVSRKRLSRAIERLRTFFSRRGVTVTAITLLAAISQNAVQAAPPGLAMQATAAASGNHWFSWPDSRFSGLEGVNVRSAFFGALWPGESAWKLRVEFRRIANFPKHELLRI